MTTLVFTKQDILSEIADLSDRIKEIRAQLVAIPSWPSSYKERERVRRLQWEIRNDHRAIRRTQSLALLDGEIVSWLILTGLER